MGSVMKHSLRTLSLSPQVCAAKTYKAAVVTKYGQPFVQQQMQVPSLQSNEVYMKILFVYAI